MNLLAIAGGAGIGDEGLCCCGTFVLLPAVLYLAGRAVIRGSVGSAILSLIIAVVPFLIIQKHVFEYQASTDREVMREQGEGIVLFGFYACMVCTAVAAVIWSALKTTLEKSRKLAPPKEEPDASTHYRFWGS